MEQLTGPDLLQAVANRIIVAYLESTGHSNVRSASGVANGYARGGVDLTYRYQGVDHKVKVKPDAYYGTDPAKVQDRDLTFYRSDSGVFAFESIANHMTREPGWMVDSTAEELYYYYLVIAQSEEEILALLGEPDEVFFSELKVERDQLYVLPMRQTQRWFDDNSEEYAPRPVVVGEHSAWFRIIPRSDIERSVEGIKTVGGVFERVSR
jgi:hypothetical protein